MSIDFFLQEQSLDKLVSTYLQLEEREAESTVRERSKKEIVILNSVIISLSQRQGGFGLLFRQVKYWLQVNDGDKKALSRAAILLKQVVRRCDSLVLKAKAQTVGEVVALAVEKSFTAVSGNSWISLLQILISKINLNENPQVLGTISDFLLSPKLLVATYRQDTRLSLYQIYLIVLNLYKDIKVFEKGREQMFIERCVLSGSGQKDPRNIGSVFEMYLKVMDIFTVQLLQSHRSTMFQNLQSYYPIEFVGDEDNQNHQTLDIKEITALLDDCLTHPFFHQEAWELLSAKTATAPIAPFVPTLMIYLSRRRIDTPYAQNVAQLKNILFRLCEEDFIAEQYSRQEFCLGDLFAALLDVIFCREDGCYSRIGQETTMKWLSLMVRRVVEGEYRHSGSMMGIFRSIIKKGSSPRFCILIDLLRHLALREILKSLNNESNMIPKLGLAIVVLQESVPFSEELTQIMGLLVLQVGKLYAQVPDEVKLLLLKLLLQVYSSSHQNRAMVRNANDSLILKDCLMRASWAFSNPLQKTQLYMVKAFIEFIDTVYSNRVTQILATVEGNNLELQSYLLGRMLQTLLKQNQGQGTAGEAVIQKFKFLISKLRKGQDVQGIFSSLSVLPSEVCCQLLQVIDWNVDRSQAGLMITLIIKLQNHYRNKQQSSIDNFVDLSKQIQHSPEQQDQPYSRFQIIWRSIPHQLKEELPSLRQLNSTFDLTKISFEGSFVEGYQPTLIHWCWQHLSNIHSSQQRNKLAAQLVQHLPQKLLLRDSHSILQILVQSEHSGKSLLKIVKHLEFVVLQEAGIVGYCLQEVLKIDSLKQTHCTSRSVAFLATLIILLEKDKQGFLTGILKKQSKQLGKLSLNNKRPIRQAMRKVTALLQRE